MTTDPILTRRYVRPPRLTPAEVAQLTADRSARVDRVVSAMLAAKRARPSWLDRIRRRR